MLSCFWHIYGANGVAAFGTLVLITAIILSLTENFLSIGSAAPLVRQAIAYHSLPAWAFGNGAIPGILGAYLMIGVAISCLHRRPSIADVAESSTTILEQEREQAAVDIERLQSVTASALCDRGDSCGRHGVLRRASWLGAAACGQSGRGWRLRHTRLQASLPSDIQTSTAPTANAAPSAHTAFHSPTDHERPVRADPAAPPTKKILTNIPLIRARASGSRRFTARRPNV